MYQPCPSLCLSITLPADCTDTSSGSRGAAAGGRGGGGRGRGSAGSSAGNNRQWTSACIVPGASLPILAQPTMDVAAVLEQQQHELPQQAGPSGGSGVASSSRGPVPACGSGRESGQASEQGPHVWVLVGSVTGAVLAYCASLAGAHGSTWARYQTPRLHITMACSIGHALAAYCPACVRNMQPAMRLHISIRRGCLASVGMVE